MATTNIQVQVDAERRQPFNKESKEALAEYEEMKAHPETYKRYKSFGDLLKDIDG